VKPTPLPPAQLGFYLDKLEELDSKDLKFIQILPVWSGESFSVDINLLYYHIIPKASIALL